MTTFFMLQCYEVIIQGNSGKQIIMTNESRELNTLSSENFQQLSTIGLSHNE